MPKEYFKKVTLPTQLEQIAVDPEDRPYTIDMILDILNRHIALNAKYRTLLNRVDNIAAEYHSDV